MKTEWDYVWGIYLGALHDASIFYNDDFVEEMTQISKTENLAGSQRQM